MVRLLRCLQMESERNAHRYILATVAVVGLLYLGFNLYYGSLRLEPNTWNSRPAKMIDHLYETDPELKAVHDRMVAEAESLSPDVTIVTAYYNLGKLNKGGMFGSYTPDRYKRWMSVFGRIDNPLIVFTDSPDIIDIFTSLRAGFPDEKTKIVPLNRTKLWSFSLAPEIKKVYSQPGYPKYDPNTVNENYSCVMHAKFELVNKVIKEKMFNTKYITWLDIGLFRAVISEKHKFPISVPADFDENKIAYSQQKSFQSHLTPFQIILEDRIWVGGAMFLGRPEVLFVYTQDYMRSVEQLLSLNMMSTDQQVIYIMYQPGFAYTPRVEIQTYTTHSSDDWFYLGYAIKEMWEMRIRRTVSVLKFMQTLL
ncbi:uncharacterized protein LOC101862011 [Aplysia californica]|uniref:Uncharacterized protein LOC101862011 n=1 Tax=Aplysia californica TaxID=6500 RepID=A0ABM0KAI8_APLCA|nr:uncharacterized protein LOC101862011 [Aplysia californica]